MRQPPRVGKDRKTSSLSSPSLRTANYMPHSLLFQSVYHIGNAGTFRVYSDNIIINTGSQYIPSVSIIRF